MFPEIQETFDLLKSVHTLNADKVFCAPLSTHLKQIANKPEVKDFIKHGFNVDFVIIHSRKTDVYINNPLRTGPGMAAAPACQISNRSDIVNQSVGLDEFRIPKLGSAEKTLKECEKDIKTFHLIVKSFKDHWDLKKFPKKWKKVSKYVMTADPTLKDMTHRRCEKDFYDWLDFYVKVFFTLCKSKFSKGE